MTVPDATARDSWSHFAVVALEERLFTDLGIRSVAAEDRRRRLAGVVREVGLEESAREIHVVVEQHEDPAACLQDAAMSGGRRPRVRLLDQRRSERILTRIHPLAGGRARAVVDHDHLEPIRWECLP